MLKALPIYEVKLPKEGFDLILGALNELPHKTVRGVLDEILQQLRDQEAAADQLESKAAAVALLDALPAAPEYQPE